jgi:hypothetical protein
MASGLAMMRTVGYLPHRYPGQSNSRATLETLAQIKNPPVVFARQANTSRKARSR